jgi:hypothetical protein
MCLSLLVTADAGIERAPEAIKHQVDHVRPAIRMNELDIGVT